MKCCSNVLVGRHTSRYQEVFLRKWISVGALTVLVDGGLGRFDLVDCLHDYRHEVTIHGDDVLAHSNWEISESWLQRYK